MLIAESSALDSDAAGAHVLFGLSIVQEHCAFRQHPRYAQYFGTCQRVGCSRPALLSPPEVAVDHCGDEPSEAKQLLQRIKDAGVAGAVSYAAWELAFWAASVPVCLVAYYQLTGHWPDFSNQDDMAKLGAEALSLIHI